MPKIIGVRFKKAGKVYHFSAEGFELKKDDGVIVETSRGLEYGSVVFPPRDAENSETEQVLKPVIRVATEKDIDLIKRNNEKRDATLATAIEKVRKHNLDMKIVDVEHTFDGSKIILYFTADGRVDFRDLVKDLASAFRVRIELRQIGIRDECKMLGGIAPCGRPCCCNNHLADFERVSIKMAKNQGLSLNPGKISGLCGRLMCCLEYENAHYAETNKRMPKMGSEVATPDGNGTVFSLNVLKERVTVKLPNKETFELKTYELADLNIKNKPAHESGAKVDHKSKNKPAYEKPPKHEKATKVSVD